MLPQYQHAKTFFGDTTPLPLASGYAIVLGFGAFFSVFTTVLVFLDQKFNGTQHTSEYFNTAGRNVKTGLTASVIVSQWTWAATLLQSSNVAWNYGVSGPFWYASGATIQILLFGILAIEVKRRSRTSHTFCEMVQSRWGKTAHKTFIFFGFLANIIVTSMLLLGGAATVNALTGMNVDLACFLIPWGVILYTASGGLKATFLASYIHTGIIFFVLVICVYTVYVKEFSTDLVYDGLQRTTGYTLQECEAIFSDKDGVTFFKPGKHACGAVPDNNGGSYLTMLSLGGLKFGIINIVGNFGTVFVDQAYWQSAIAAKPASAHKGYLLGGIVWFTIPFALATSMGLCSLSVQLPLSSGEAGAGLVPPAVATHLFGEAGAVMIAIMLFMAITSTGSAEGIAVASLVAYDIYKAYFHPRADGKQVLMASKATVVVFGLTMGGLAVALNYMKLNLGWVYMFMGNAIGSAVVPLWNLLMWKDANATGAIAGAFGGQIMALGTWMVWASVQSGEVSVDSLGQLEPNLAGNLVAICSSGAIHVCMSLMNPQNYDFKSMGKIAMLEADMRGLDERDFDGKFLDEAKTWINKWGWTFTILMVVVWPVLSVPAGVFSKGYFAMWVFLSLAWSFVATFAIISLPLIESADAILGMCYAIVGKKYTPKEQQERTVTKGRCAVDLEALPEGTVLPDDEPEDAEPVVEEKVEGAAMSKVKASAITEIPPEWTQLTHPATGTPLPYYYDNATGEVTKVGGDVTVGPPSAVKVADAPPPPPPMEMANITRGPVPEWSAEAEGFQSTHMTLALSAPVATYCGASLPHGAA